MDEIPTISPTSKNEAAGSSEFSALDDIRKNASSEDGTSSISHTETSAPAISLQSHGDAISSETNEHIEKSPISDYEGTALPSDKQTSDEENAKNIVESEGKNTLQSAIDAASAEVNTNPTEAQKEAGNYKKGHV